MRDPHDVEPFHTTTLPLDVSRCLSLLQLQQLRVDITEDLRQNIGVRRSDLHRSVTSMESFQEDDACSGDRVGGLHRLDLPLNVTQEVLKGYARTASLLARHTSASFSVSLPVWHCFRLLHNSTGEHHRCECGVVSGWGRGKCYRSEVVAGEWCW